MSPRAASRSEDEAVRCPAHDPGHCPGEEGGCAALQRSSLLDDRVLATEGLVTEVRSCLLGNCKEVMTGVSLTAALEAARLLARSITREVDVDPKIGHGDGEARVRWAVMYPEREEQAQIRRPVVLALRRRKR
jgi:hypothetical protein